MKRVIRKSDLKFSIFVFVCFIFFSNIDFVINSISLLGRVKFVIIPLTCIILGLIYLFRLKMYMSTILVEIAYTLIIIATIINGRSVRNAVSILLPSMAMMLLFNYGIERKEEVFLSTIKKILFLFMVINILTVIFLPDGLYFQDGPNWLFGLKNVHVRYILPGVAMIVASDLKSKKQLVLVDYVLIAIGILNNTLVKSSTGLVGMLLFSALIISDNFRGKITKKIVKFLLNPFVIVAAVSLLYYFVLLGEKSFLGIFVSKYFGKDLTFTGRSYVWARCIELIIHKPFVGYGYVNSDDFFKLIGVGIGAHPHNYVLGWAFYGGFISLTFIIVAYIHLLKRVRHNTSVEARVYLWAVISFFLMGITDVGILSVLFHPMILLCEYYTIQKKQA